MNEYFDEYKKVLKKFADFEGRATVREYWSFYLINSAVGLLLGLIVPVLALLLYFGVLLPSIAVGVRRLHDQNRSGLYWFIAFIPFGVLVLLFWATQPGTGGSNDYGPDPLGRKGQLPTSGSRNTGSSQRFPSPRRLGVSLHCSNCDATVSESAKFCPQCGKVFEDPSCPKCGAEPPEDAAFCDQCGHDLREVEEAKKASIWSAGYVEPPQPAWVRVCRSCGADIGDQDPYCPVCKRTPRP